MPNTLIDMGFNSTIQMFIWNRNGGLFGTQIAAGWPTSTEGAQAMMRPYVSWIRDRIKLAMEAENDGLNWRVGRIFEWEGQTIFGSRKGYHYGFIIQRLVGGVPDDHEFLFSMSGLFDDLNPSNLGKQTQGWGVSVADGTIPFRAISGGSDSYIAMHHNPLGTLSTYDVDANPVDTYNVANDFNPPNSNPFSDINGFMPDRTQSPWVPGWSIYQDVPGSNSDWYMNINRWCLMFNHELPFIAYYRCKLKAYSLRDFACLGRIIVPRVNSDSWRHGTIMAAVFHGSGVEYDPQIFGLHPNGTQSEEFTSAYAGQHSQFNMSNQPRADGTYDRDLYKIWNTNIDKGHMNPNVWVVMSQYVNLNMRLFDADYGTMLSFIGSICIPWTANDPIFPGGYPTNGWFGPRIQDSVP